MRLRSPAASRAALGGLERIPGWVSGAMLFAAGGACSTRLATGTLAGLSQVTPVVLLLLNCVFVCLGVLVVWSRSVKVLQTWREARLFVDRTWKIVTQGASSAGLVGSDLGDPDEEGVYYRKTGAGNHVFLRFAKGFSENQSWEWSFDKHSWMPTSKADFFWPNGSGGPLSADKIFIQRLEVECALRAQLPDLPACTHPPPIHLELTHKEEARLMKNVPKDFLCPVSLEIMIEPVVSPSGVTYNRSSIEEWINENHTDPATKAPLIHDNLYPNLALRDMIQAWLVEQKFVMT